MPECSETWHECVAFSPAPVKNCVCHVARWAEVMCDRTASGYDVCRIPFICCATPEYILLRHGTSGKQTVFHSCGTRKTMIRNCCRISRRLFFFPVSLRLLMIVVMTVKD